MRARRGSLPLTACVGAGTQREVGVLLMIKAPSVLSAVVADALSGSAKSGTIFYEGVDGEEQIS